MLVRDVMNEDVKTITPSATVKLAAQRMHRYRIGCLIVHKGAKLAGIITDSDILGKVAARDKKPSTVKVEQIMTRDLVLIEDDRHISKAVELMEAHKIKKLPVVSGTELVGILTVADLAMAQPKLIKQVSNLVVFPKNSKNVAG
jgi:CBS domain-containing protein